MQGQVEEKRLLELTKRLSLKLPRFPDGRIDYRHSKISPVVNVILARGGKILLLRRSNKVGAYRDMWGVVSGYVDELRPMRDIALKEIREEIGVLRKNIIDIKIGKLHKVKDDDIGRTWISCPILARLKTGTRILLDWENTKAKWIRPEELKNFNTFPGLDRSWKNVSRFFAKKD